MSTNILFISKNKTISLKKIKLSQGKFNINGMTYIFQSDKIYKFKGQFDFLGLFTKHIYIYEENNPYPVSLNPDIKYNNKGIEINTLLQSKVLQDWLGIQNINFVILIIMMILGFGMGIVSRFL